MRPAYVFFAAPVKATLLSSVYVAANRSPVVHVAIGDGHAVLNPRWSGNTYWPFKRFTHAYPSLVSAFLVFTPHAIDLIVPSTRCSVWAAIERYATRGEADTPECPLNDCIGIVRTVLRNAGFDTPPFQTATAFERWLTERQYQHVRF